MTIDILGEDAKWKLEMKWTTFTLGEYLEREQNIVFCGNITNWYLFSKSIAYPQHFNGDSFCLADWDLIKILHIFESQLFPLKLPHCICPDKSMLWSLGLSGEFPKSTKLCWALSTLIQFYCFVLLCTSCVLYFEIYVFKYNKLAKLGDPIAISKCETINHSPTHSLTDWLYFICHKFGFKFFKFSFENTNTITDRGSTATHSKAKLDGLDWIGCYLESLSSKSTVLFLKFFPLKVFRCVASSWDL